jgi:hypothetical protein
VGDRQISVATFNREFVEEMNRESPADRLVPPNYTACVIRLKSDPEAQASHEESPAALKRECEAKYQALREHVVSNLIVREWIIGGAHELGVDGAVDAKIATFKNKSLTRASRSDLDAEAIRERILGPVKHVTPDLIAAYYRAHERQFFMPEERDLKIVRANTEAAALQVKREIASGKSFGAIVEHLPQPQPIFTAKGLVRGLKLKSYSQVKLERALFSAPVGALRGPVRITLGYYVFRVEKIHPGHQLPLSSVRASIKATLPETLERAALARYVRQWRRTWRAKTICAPSYVVFRCAGFRPRPGETPQQTDPYSLD